MPEIVVHGASGFLGRHFGRFLAMKKIPFVIIGRETSDLSAFDSIENCKIIRYKTTLVETLNQIPAIHDGVFFDFAWQGVFGSERNQVSQIVANVPNHLQSIELASVLKCKHWVGIGSQAEYGRKESRIFEHDALLPETIYGKSKVIASQMSESLCKSLGLEFSWLRLFSVYGPNDNHPWLIPYLIQQMAKGDPVDVTKGEQFWDYLYIGDVCESLFKLSSTKGVGFANLSSGKAIQVKELILLVKEIMLSKSEIHWGKIPYRPDQVMFMEGDNQKLSRHCGWTPTTNLRTGLTETIRFYQNHFNEA